MIDRAARNRAALLVRRLAIDRITWDEFDDALSGMEFNAQDTVFVSLAETAVYWNEGTARRELARWVLFLQTDNEYRWPSEELRDNTFTLLTIFAGVIGFMFWGSGYVLAGTCLLALTAVVSTAWQEYQVRRKRRGGDKSVWPFFHTHELEKAMLFPRLLCKQVS